MYKHKIFNDYLNMFSCDTESLNPQVSQEPKNSDQSSDSGTLTLMVAIVAGSVVCVLVGAFIIFCSIVIRKENKNCPFKTTNFSKCVRMKKADMTKLAQLKLTQWHQQGD